MIFRAALMIALCMVASMAMAQAPDIENMDLVERATPDGPVARVRVTSISRGAFLYLYRTQLAEVARFKRMETAAIPDWIDYEQIRQLRFEARQKLAQVRPRSLGQASRIRGVGPAELSVLMVYVRGKRSPTG